MRNRHLAITGCFVAALLLNMSLESRAAVRAYMRVGDIEGGSTVNPPYSDILDYTISVQNGGWDPSGDGGGSSSPSLSNMYVTKLVDKASPLLFGSVLMGTHYPTADIELWRGDDTLQRYVSWSFQDVVVSSYNTAKIGDTVMDLVALDYGRITYTYWNGNSPIGFTWDRATNDVGWFGSGGMAGFQFIPEYHSPTVPEPATLALLGTCAAAFLGWRWMKRRTPGRSLTHAARWGKIWP
jgi:type VI secretion system secreted protein Hcp